MNAVIEPQRAPRNAMVRSAAACLLAAIVAGLVSSGCLAPIGAEQATSRVAYREFTETALTGGASDSSRAVLQRYDLREKFEDDPGAALSELHWQACRDDRRDALYALAELNYLHAERLWRSVRAWEPGSAPQYYLAAGIYSYLYLFSDGSEPPPGPYDRRLRKACDLYNSAIAHAFMTPGQTNSLLVFKGGMRSTPVAPVRLEERWDTFRWRTNEIQGFLAADRYVIRGLSVRDRRSGLGAPLIMLGHTKYPKELPRRAAATMFLRVHGGLKDWDAGNLRAAVEVYASTDADHVTIGGRTVPLEADWSAPLAYALNDSFLWDLGLDQFFSPEEKVRTDIYPTQPYRPGQIPVIFVHGTASSPVWWAEMWNTLRADPVLGKNFQFWNFVYTTGVPVPQSAARLRAAIEAKVRLYDPEGREPALQQMVVIGHSQGGLLAKMTAMDSGDKLWRLVSDKSIEESGETPEMQRMLRETFVFQPLPSVRRVVFIATPHRGSFLATGFVRQLLRRFMNFPTDAMSLAQSIAKLGRGVQRLPPDARAVVPTSVDGMSPTNQFLLAMAGIPVGPRVTAHSIVAIKGDDQPPAGSDGVVEYASAHVEYARSERVVRSGHSCQDKPATIEEVRRILLEHLREFTAGPAAPEAVRQAASP